MYRRIAHTGIFRSISARIRDDQQCAEAISPLQANFTIRHIAMTPKARDKKLFTPGPLGISRRVKEKMLRDIGSRENEFIQLIRFIRQKLLQIAGASETDFTVIPMQGSGTFALESAFTTSLPRSGAKVLVLENGAYGKRLADICRFFDVEVKVLSYPETDKVDAEDAARLCRRDKFSHVAMVHCETSTGVINPVDDIVQAIKQSNSDTIAVVDAMSSFGAVPFSMKNIDVMISSVNKCLQGVPGFGYVFLRKNLLAKSLSLDLAEQCSALDKTGQFRFTPPTHAMLAFKEALLEFEEEGGISGRGARYKQNFDIINDGMKELGIRTLLDQSKHPDSYIITSYHYPDDPKFTFKEFYDRLYAEGQVIYPGKVTNADCFRVGSIGDLWPDDMRNLLGCIKNVLLDMEIRLPLS